MTKPILAEQFDQLLNVSAEKAKEIDRASRSPGSGRMQIIELVSLVHASDIQADTKRRISDMLVRLIEHSQMEERCGTLLTNSDVGFLKRLEAKHPNISPKDALVLLFIKLGYDTREIARRRGISTRGMESIRYRIHKKMGRGRHQALKTYLGDL